MEIINAHPKSSFSRLFSAPWIELALFLTLSHFLLSIPAFGGFFGGDDIIPECFDDGKPRIKRDCSKDIEYQARAFSLRIDVLDKIKVEGSTEKKALQEADKVLKLLQWQSQELCKDWNTCAITREEFNKQSKWLRKPFPSFITILESVKLNELNDPALKEKFLNKIFKWYEDTSRENEKVDEIWKNIKCELDKLKGEIKDEAYKGAEKGANEGVQKEMKSLELMMKEQFAKLSPPIPLEEMKKQIDNLKTSVEKKDLEKAHMDIEWGMERLEAENYEKAITNFENALMILPDGSEASVSTRYNLSIALINCQTGDREANLDKAIQSYNKILPLLKDKNLVSYARVLNNLGVSYSDLSEVKDKEDNLGCAFKAYQAALKVYTFEKSPQNYAMTQTNLGSAYRSLSEARDKEDNLGRAIKACQEALKVCTFEKFPQDYAMTQMNLGSAYGGLSEVRDKESNLGLAINAYQEALKIYTFEKFPQYYEKIKENLVLANRGLSELRNKDLNP
jgi:tetratricopeptide (TPR) repeat protein